MKYIQIALFVALLSLTAAFAQPLMEHSLTENLSIPPQVQEVLDNRPLLRYEAVRFDHAQFEAEQVTIRFFEHEVVINRLRNRARSEGDFSWFGRNEVKEAYATFTVMEGKVMGTIGVGLKTYHVRSYFGFSVVEELKPEAYAGQECATSERLDPLYDHDSESIESFPGSNHEVPPVGQDSPDNINGVNPVVGLPYACRLRILTLYTQAAETEATVAGQDIVLVALCAADQMNMSFINCDVDREIELVNVRAVDHAENNWNNPLNFNAAENEVEAFLDPTDGTIDEVHNLRNVFSADYCALLGDYADNLTGLLGIVRFIKTSAPNSFTVMDWEAATDLFTFTHEVGHLIGSRHDNDGDIVPFEHGHGFTDIAANVRTIMGTGNANRILFWSSPDIIQAGVIIGDINLQDNTRVMRENLDNPQLFRQPVGNQTITITETMNMVVGDVVSDDRIQTDGNVVVNNGDQLFLRAVNRISLRPGFAAQAGSRFDATIETIFDCGVADGLGSDFRAAFSEKLLRFTTTVSPQPANSYIEVSLNGDVFYSEQFFAVILFDALGRCVSKHQGQLLKRSLRIDISALVPGFYALKVIKGNDQVSVQQIIIN